MEDGVRRELVLLRHAKSAWPDVPDHQRPLARRGRRDAPVMGRWLYGAGHVPDRVLCSTALRADQTWQLAQAGLGVTPPVSFDDELYLGSAVQLLDLIRGTPPAARTLLIVGHDPAIPELALTLAATGQAAAFDRMRAKFPTAAVAVLEFGGNWDRLAPGSARLISFVTPRDLATKRPGLAEPADDDAGQRGSLDLLQPGPHSLGRTRRSGTAATARPAGR
jgi:phosphohistidine phosphatase